VSREHVIGDRDQHEAGEPEAAQEPHGLPPELHARLIMMGPRHASALRELLVAYPRMSTRILAVASPRMGLSAVQSAIAAARETGEATASEPGDDAQRADAEPVAASVEGAAAPEAVVDSDRGPSEKAIAVARAYNRRHRHHVAVFNAATERSCVGSDGELDPIAVWRWQADHGIGHDGCVGPVSAATARAAGKPTPAVASEPTAPAGPDAAVDVAAPAVDAAAPAVDVAAPAVDAVAPAVDVAAPAVDVAAPVTAPAPPAAEVATTAPAPVVAPVASVAPPVAEVAGSADAAAPTDAAPSVAAQPEGEAAAATDTEQAPQGGGQPEVSAAPTVPARADNGGPGSLARRALARGSATAAFRQLSSERDATLRAHLADYGNLAEQRALLDAVVSEGEDAILVKNAFHAYWHVEVTGIDVRTAAQAWPIPVLQAIHHQLKVLPDKDARNGAWTKLSLKNNGEAVNRGFWSKSRGEGDFSMVGKADSWTKSTWNEGYVVKLTEPAAASASTLEVSEGGRFKVGAKLALDRAKPERELVTIASISGNTYTLAAPLQHDHRKSADLEPDNASASRKVSWLDYTVRHEIAHSLDGGKVEGKGFYALGGWQSNSPLALDQWVKAMGGDSARKGNGISIPDDMPKGTPESEDRSWFKLKLALDTAVNSGARSIFPANPAFRAYQGKGVPIIDAIEAALGGGRSFYNEPTSVFAANGKRFSINFEQRQIQNHDESVLTDRVTNYAISAPAEFFAETYAVFYEEAGHPGVTDADHGRLIRNGSQRKWMREHVHNRGQAPAGTGAGRAAEGTRGGGEEEGAHNEGPRRGKKSGDPGL
jgi:hypothetical protein